VTKRWASECVPSKFAANHAYDRPHLSLIIEQAIAGGIGVDSFGLNKRGRLKAASRANLVSNYLRLYRRDRLASPCFNDFVIGWDCTVRRQFIDNFGEIAAETA
jgi:hypothetical protein